MDTKELSNSLKSLNVSELSSKELKELQSAIALANSKIKDFKPKIDHQKELQDAVAKFNSSIELFKKKYNGRYFVNNSAKYLVYIYIKNIEEATYIDSSDIVATREMFTYNIDDHSFSSETERISLMYLQTRNGILERFENYCKGAFYGYKEISKDEYDCDIIEIIKERYNI